MSTASSCRAPGLRRAGKAFSARVHDITELSTWTKRVPLDPRAVYHDAGRRPDTKFSGECVTTPGRCLNSCPWPGKGVSRTEQRLVPGAEPKRTTTNTGATTGVKGSMSGVLDPAELGKITKRGSSRSMTCENPLGRRDDRI